jgi:hypothetical protein
MTTVRLLRLHITPHGRMWQASDYLRLLGRVVALKRVLVGWSNDNQ